MHEVLREGTVPFAELTLPGEFQLCGVKGLSGQDEVATQFLGPAGFDELEKA